MFDTLKHFFSTKQPPLPSPFEGLDEALEVSACLWEAVIEMRRDHQYIDVKFEAEGTVAVRGQVCRGEVVAACEIAWREAVEEDRFDGCFDWNWCPKFIWECLDCDFNLRPNWRQRAKVIST